jgi:hypothetical protein
MLESRGHGFSAQAAELGAPRIPLGIFLIRFQRKTEEQICSSGLFSTNRAYLESQNQKRTKNSGKHRQAQENG